MAKQLRVRLLVNPARARIWQRRLAEALRARGHHVAVGVRHGTTGAPLAVSLLLMLERLVYGQRDHAAAGEWRWAELEREAAASESDQPDLVLDLTGAETPAGPIRTLRPTYAGSLVEEFAIFELLEGRIPQIGLLDSASPQSAPLSFRAAVERPRVLCKALDNLCARLVTIFTGAVDDIAAGRALSGDAAPTFVAPSPRHLGVLEALTARARAALTSLSASPPHWFVGWRVASGNRMSETMRVPQGG